MQLRFFALADTRGELGLCAGLELCRSLPEDERNKQHKPSRQNTPWGCQPEYSVHVDACVYVYVYMLCVQVRAAVKSVCIDSEGRVLDTAENIPQSLLGLGLPSRLDQFF